MGDLVGPMQGGLSISMGEAVFVDPIASIANYGLYAQVRLNAIDLICRQSSLIKNGFGMQLMRLSWKGGLADEEDENEDYEEENCGFGNIIE